jgi:predicted ester cyclase
MTAEITPEAVVRGLYNAINERDFDAVNVLLSDDWIDHQEFGTGNKAEFILEIQRVIVGLPDFTITVEAILPSSAHVTARLSLTGTHLGKFLGTAPTGRKLEFRAHDIHRVVADRIAESWQVEDWFSAFEQMTVAALPKRSSP